jgi:hypothetical protein
MHHRLRLLGLALALGCGPGPPPNIVLIVVDTLRADRLGDYGGTRNLTPTIDALAERGTVFQRAYAQTSWTSPSVASLMTSRYPLQHGVLVFNSVLPPSEVTLAELLQEEGYATGGFSANAALSAERGYAQGFDEYASFTRDAEPGPVLGRYARADQVNASVLEWVDGLAEARPLFLYIQYMEPHIPYFPSSSAVEQLRPGRPILELTDLPPTLLDLVGIPIPDEFEGHSLRPFLEQPSWLAQLRNRAFGRPNRFQGPGAALTELHRAPFGTQAPLHRRSLVAGDRKIVAGHSGAIEFYDIRGDPLEQNPDALTPSEREILRDRFEVAVRKAMTALDALARPVLEPVDSRVQDHLWLLQ